MLLATVLSSKKHLRGSINVIINGAVLICDLFKRDAYYLSASHRRHPAELAAQSKLDRMHAEPRGENSIISGRRASALNVAQHSNARLDASALLDLACDQLADPSEMPFTKDARFLIFRQEIFLEVRLRIFGDNDDREWHAHLFALRKQVANLGYAKGNLRHKDQIGGH